MNQTQLNLACASFQNVDGATLHTDHPGNTGANDSGITKVSLTAWSDPVTGVMSADAPFPSVPAGEYPYLGLWDGTVFIDWIQINLVTSQTIPVTVTIEHHAKVRA